VRHQGALDLADDGLQRGVAGLHDEVSAGGLPAVDHEVGARAVTRRQGDHTLGVFAAFRLFARDLEGVGERLRDVVTTAADGAHRGGGAVLQDGELGVHVADVQDRDRAGRVDAERVVDQRVEAHRADADDLGVHARGLQRLDELLEHGAFHVGDDERDTAVRPLLHDLVVVDQRVQVDRQELLELEGQGLFDLLGLREGQLHGQRRDVLRRHGAEDGLQQQPATLQETPRGLGDLGDGRFATALGLDPLGGEPDELVVAKRRHELAHLDHVRAEIETDDLGAHHSSR
jgi:hypothetical protein